MAGGQLLRAELNVTTVADGRLYRAELDAVASGKLYRAEFDASSATDGLLFRAELDSVQSADGLLYRAELNSTLTADGRIFRAELSSSPVPVSGGPVSAFIEPWSTVTLQGIGGNPTPTTVLWTQTGGPSVALSGSGDKCTFVAPPSQATLTFQYSVDGATAEVQRVVLPPTENDVVNILRPIHPVG
jgi:hypothetical protein